MRLMRSTDAPVGSILVSIETPVYDEPEPCFVFDTPEEAREEQWPQTPPGCLPTRVRMYRVTSAGVREIDWWTMTPAASGKEMG